MTGNSNQQSTYQWIQLFAWYVKYRIHNQERKILGARADDLINLHH